VFTARYGLGPYITEIRFVFNGFYNCGAVFTARYGLGPYITEIRFVFNGFYNCGAECLLRGTDWVLI
jgi:hypothetical protein